MVATAWVAAATPSAGSLRLSMILHWTFCPNMPPAWLMRLTAVKHPATCSAPKFALGPVNELSLPKTSGPLRAVDDDEVVVPQAASKTADTTNTADAQPRLPAFNITTPLFLRAIID